MERNGYYYQTKIDDDVDARLEEPIKTATGIVQGEGTDAEMTEAQQGNENLATTQEQVIEDAHVTISTVLKKTEVPVTGSSCSSDLASKFLNFSDIPHTDAKIVSPLDVPVHHEVPRTQAPTLLTIPDSVIPESSSVFTNIPQSSHTFTPTPIQTTPTPPPIVETRNPLSNLPDFASIFRFNDKITALEKEVADLKKDPLHTQVTSLVDSYLDTRLGETREEFINFLSESLTARIKEQSRNEVILAKVSSQLPSSYEVAASLTEFKLKKILIDKIEKSESYLTAPQHRDRQDKDKDEDPSAGSDRGLKKRKRSKDTEPTNEPKKKDSTSGSSKPQPKSFRKSVQLEEPVFEVADSDMPQDHEGIQGDNEDSNSSVAYDKYALWGISYWRAKRKSFYAFARGMQSRGDMYSKKRILAVTHVSVIRKYEYGYLEEIVVRRADNVLYRFKEGDFSRLRINDIEDMLILVVHNRLSNLSGDDVADFAIALRMYTRSLVIQKRIEDLQLGVESYQKKINVTKPDTTRSDLQKRHLYTPYKDPQGFIYVDDNRRNMLMRSDELYMFSDGTLTRLLSSLEDITKNIDMSYLPKRR
ncbi:hypothetical protein Tco_0225988 [Tanacetum coccineum]